MERHSSNAMFISEIPVRYSSTINNDETIIKWISNLNSQTTARDVVRLSLPTCDPSNYLLVLHTDRKKLIVKDSSRIYRIVAKINQQQCSRRLLFEIRLKKVKKHVRFADEITVQTIAQRPSSSSETVRKSIIATKSYSLEKRMLQIKENFQQHIRQQQEDFLKSCSKLKRSSLCDIIEHIPRSSSESGISSNSSVDDSIVPTRKILETLV